MESEIFSLITRYSDNHCLVTGYSDNRYTTRLTQPILPQGTPYGGAAQPSNEIQSTKHYVRIYHQKMQNKANFRNTQINVNLYYTKVYKNKSAFRRKKNKPNQSQFKPNQTQFPKRPKMNLKLCKIMTYEYTYNRHLAKTNPNKPNSNSMDRKRIKSPISPKLTKCPIYRRFTLYVDKENR